MGGRVTVVLVVVGMVSLLASLLIAVFSEPHYSEFVLSCGNHAPAHTVAAPEPTAMSIERILELTERQGCSMWHRVIQQ